MKSKNTKRWNPVPAGGKGCKYWAITWPELKLFPLIFPTIQCKYSDSFSVKWPSGLVKTNVQSESGSLSKKTWGIVVTSFGLITFPLKTGVTSSSLKSYSMTKFSVGVK